jgi:hypothetical protein
LANTGLRDAYDTCCDDWMMIWAGVALQLTVAMFMLVFEVRRFRRVRAGAPLAKHAGAVGPLALAGMVVVWLTVGWSWLSAALVFVAGIVAFQTAVYVRHPDPVERVDPRDDSQEGAGPPADP